MPKGDSPCIGVKSLVCGFGVNDSEAPVIVSGVKTPEYALWLRMIHRCYNSDIHKTQPTYADAEVCEDWKYFSNFKVWYDQNYKEGYVLDKDLFIEGNKIYSPKTCTFVPAQINTMFNIRNSSRGEYPLGVSYHKKKEKYIASYRHLGRVIQVGAFDCPDAAHEEYKKAKTLVVMDYLKEQLDSCESGTKLKTLLELLISRVEKGTINFLKKENKYG